MSEDPRGEFVAHRHTIAARSGDAHVIGADGVARNVDQAARDEAADASAAEARARPVRPVKAPAEPAPAIIAPDPAPAPGA
ncbi:MAG: hypothetical protein FP826_09290 [Sphingomonadales bacterium]|nr:hypothetical protein [Sphingomonadales bacterium]MBU3991567.1 hypothetical protein [Alphaproteobacteria bacterium]